MVVKRRIPILFLACGYFVFYVGVLRPLDGFSSFRLSVEDWFSRLRYDLVAPPAEVEQFVYVLIDDESIRRSKLRWPWDRRILASGIDRLREAGVRIICLDQVLAGSTDSESDHALEVSIAKAGNVVLASYVGDRGRYVVPCPSFAEAAVAVGPVNKIPTEPDNRVRFARVVYLSSALQVEDFSLEVKVAAEFLDASPKFVEDKLLFVDQAGNTVRQIPVRVDGVIPISYVVHRDTVNAVPFYKLLEGTVPKERLSGKVVIFGSTAKIVHDVHSTPLGLQKGVDVSMNTILTLFSKNPVRNTPILIQWGLLLFCALIVAVATYTLSFQGAFLLTAGFLLSFWLASLWLILHYYSWDFVGLPLVVLALYLTGTFERMISLAVELAKLRVEATTDDLTGVANHGYFLVRLKHERALVKRNGTSLAVIMLDVDHFKSINDQHGHAIGNRVLKELVARMKSVVRTAGIIARFGGDEFGIILPDTKPGTALACAERLRRAVSRESIQTRTGFIPITLSIGVAAIHGDAQVSAEELVEQADAALYQSKRLGRNRASLFSEVCDQDNPGKDSSK